MSRLQQKYPHLLPVLIFFIIGAITYLPNASRFGLYNDEWYLMYAARVLGPEFFDIVFSSDRPARAPLQFILYLLFGENILYYHISAYFFRTIGAITVYFFLNDVWPEQRRISFLAAILFLVYPGFLLQIYAVDFQAHLFSLMSAMLSVWFSIRAVLASGKTARFTLFAFAILTGWTYLALMEYLVGIEALRFALLLILAWRKTSELRQKIIYAICSSVPFILAPGGFLIWRLFIFESDRRATDIGAQLGVLFSSPTTGLWWLIYILQDIISVIFAAWFVPLYNMVFSLRLRDLLPTLAIGVLAAALFWFVFQKYLPKKDEQKSNKEFLVISVLALLGGLLPVILSNRHVNFGGEFRYTLHVLPAVSVMLAIGLLQLKNLWARTTLTILLVATSVMVHQANALEAAHSAESTQNFWWQVAWRVPDMEPGTTLLASYPNIPISEDYIIWGPANQIYAPEPQGGTQVNVPFPALVLDGQTLIKVQVGRGEEERLRRGIFTNTDYRKVLILTQPTSNTCMRALDGHLPELSENDRLEIRLVASSSRLDGILPSANPHTPPTSYFGPEPPHTWCYYYQKASLARQLEDWETVAQLGEQALNAGFYPSDKIEWLPFMQAYVKLGQPEKLQGFISIMGESRFTKQQACAILSASTDEPEMQEYIQNAYCQ
jgi:hypothetical protein